jgi:hypothetical protein
LADLINSFHPARATVKPVVGMDHYMAQASSTQDSASDPNARREFASAVLAEITAWLQRVTRNDGHS